MKAEKRDDFRYLISYISQYVELIVLFVEAQNFFLLLTGIVERGVTSKTPIYVVADCRLRTRLYLP